MLPLDTQKEDKSMLSKKPVDHLALAAKYQTPEAYIKTTRNYYLYRFAMTIAFLSFAYITDSTVILITILKSLEKVI